MTHGARGLLSTVALLLAVGCGRQSAAIAAYDGPYPSAAAVAALQRLEGAHLQGTALGSQETALVVERFAVIQNPVTGTGPVVTLRVAGTDPGPLLEAAGQGENGRWYLPVQSSGDAADLVRRVTGAAPEDFGGAMSEPYLLTVGAEEP